MPIYKWNVFIILANIFTFLIIYGEFQIMIKQKIQLLTKAVFAGLLVGIAASVYLATYADYKMLGALLFGFALLFVISYSLNLFTGKVGYVIDHQPSFLLDILLMIIGNFIGGLIVALLIRLSGLTFIFQQAIDFTAIKMAKAWWEVLGQSILCGMLMYLAVEGFKRVENIIVKPLVVIFAVMIFIYSGYEHSIANMFYFTVGLTWTPMVFGYFIIMLVGNGIGSIIINGLEKLAGLKK